MDFQQAYKIIIEELGGALSKVDPEGVMKLIEAIEGAKRIFVVGAGRSGLMMRTFAMRLMQMGLESYVAGETTTPPINAGDLILVGSASGETGGPVSTARIAKNPRVKIIAITVFADSTLGKLADLAVTIPAPTPKVKRSQAAASVQPMGSLFEQSLLALLDAVILLLMERRRLTGDQMFQRHAVLE
jgi:6-phospho-3-hexuloisomerase